MGGGHVGVPNALTFSLVGGAATPLDVDARQVVDAYHQVQLEERRQEEREKRAVLRRKQRAQAHIDESADKIKKRQKQEKIIALRHDAPVDNLNAAEDGSAGTPSTRFTSPAATPSSASTPANATDAFSFPDT